MSNPVNGSITSNSSHVDFASQGEVCLSISFKGTFTGVVVAFQVSDDGGVTWYTCRAYSRTAGTASATATLADSTSIMFMAWIMPGHTFRVQATGWATGTANVVIQGAMRDVPVGV